MKIRIFAMMAMLLLCSTCTACGAADDKPLDTGGIPDTETAESEAVPDYLDTLPVYDLSGGSIRIAANSQDDRPNLHTGAENGEVINDAMVNRDRIIGELYQTDIVYTAFDSRGSLSDEISKVVRAGDDVYDFVIGPPCQCIGNLSQEGFFVDLMSLDALKTDQEWWNQSMNSTMMHDGKQFAAAGPIALCYLYSPYAFFVNLSMTAKYGLPNPYELVTDGTWSIGIMNHRTIKEHTGHLFPGGFITSGKFTYTTVGLLEENDNKNTNAINQIVVCALPDDRTVVTMQYCTALRRCWLVRVDPLYYHVPNDIFNDEKRIYTQKENSIAVDGILTAAAVYGGDIRVHKRTARTIGLQDISVPVADISECIVYRDRGMLRTDLLLIGGTDTPGWYDKDSVLFDFGAVFHTDDQSVSAKAITDGSVRAVQILGDDGKLYVVIMNFGSSHVCGNAFQITYDLDGGMCAVYCEQTKL